MIARQQLPVATPISARSLARAVVPALSGNDGPRVEIVRRLGQLLGADHVALTDSGTSALVMALRMAVGKGGTVAFPGYACVDLAAAALYAGVRVRLYDIDPATLGPDFDSLERAARRGVDAILVAHLYGYPVPVHDVGTLAARHGAVVIEDAAQGAGALLAGRRLGALGDLGVLSFGRGKGLGGGSGGAIVAGSPDWAGRVASELARSPRGGRGWRDLAIATVQTMIGRPSLYGVPASIPSLKLGQMVYRPAHEPRGISRVAASIVRDALETADAERERRAANAARFDALIDGVSDARPIRPAPTAVPGYLRYPIRDLGERAPDARHGVLRGYPEALHEQRELRLSLHDHEPPTPGSIELRKSLFTLPTHRMVSERDHHAIAAWLRARRPGRQAEA